jgi:hypothetical protein
MAGQRSNQLNYVPTRQINKMRNRQCLCGFARIAHTAWSCLCCLKERDSCPNRSQTAYKFHALTTVLRTMIRADGQEENKGKPRPKHLNSFLFEYERSCRIFLQSPSMEHTASFETLPTPHPHFHLEGPAYPGIVRSSGVNAVSLITLASEDSHLVRA